MPVNESENAPNEIPHLGIHPQIHQQDLEQEFRKEIFDKHENIHILIRIQVFSHQLLGRFSNPHRIGPTTPPLLPDPDWKGP